MQHSPRWPNARAASRLTELKTPQLLAYLSRFAICLQQNIHGILPKSLSCDPFTGSIPHQGKIMRQTLLMCLLTAGACFSQTTVYTVRTFAGGGGPLGDGGWAAS